MNGIMLSARRCAGIAFPRAVQAFVLALCMLPAAGAYAADCNLNSVQDNLDISGGTSTDCNTNGVPDECEFGQGLAAHWRLDSWEGETAYEDVAGYDGTLVDYLVSDAWTSGFVGNALSFDGFDHFVTHDFNLPVTGTIAHWLRPEQIRAMVAYYESDGSSSRQNGFGDPIAMREIHTAVATSGIYFFIFQDGPDSTSQVRLQGPPAQAGVWVHLAVTWDPNSDFVMYVNGVETDRVSAASYTFEGRAPTYRQFGRVGNGQTDRHWDGLMDDVRVYNRALTAHEIERLAELLPFDCNANGVPDECDIAGLTSADCQLDGMPDECQVTPMPPRHTCCTYHTTAGCTDPDIEQCVCALDSYCCATQWDSLCVGEVESYGCGSCAAAAASADCNANGVPDECDIVPDAATGLLTTTFAGGNGSHGAMFDLTVTNPAGITLSSFDFNVSDTGGNPVDIEVWFVTDHTSFVGKASASGAWSLMGSTRPVSAPFGSPTPADIGGETLGYGETVGIYFTRTDGGSIGYTNGPLGAFSNADVTFEDRGLGLQYPFGSSFTPRVWNGTVYYTIPHSEDVNSNGVPDECDRSYVHANALPGGDGSSWATAYDDLQAALADATTNGSILEIWVAAGTYTPAGLGGNREAAFHLLNGVAIYGGFAGDENPATFDLDDRDFEANETILSGDIGSPGDPSDNCYHVFYHPDGTNLDSTAVLDGVTISGGNANGSSPHNRGGGMFNYHSNPTVSNCAFSGNAASTHGGGMFNNVSSPTLTQCTFCRNTTLYYGGGMYNNSGNPTVANCLFRGNFADYGGGMCNSLNSPTVSSCTFSRNAADSRGGGMWNSESSPTVSNCTFSGNSAGYLGGGMSNYSYTSRPTVTNCTFSGNSAGGYGGGMCSSSSETALTNCIFWGNTGPTGPQISGDTPAVSHSCIEGGWNGVGNIERDPMLTPDGHLRHGSPCIDAGSNGAVPPDTLDLDGDGNTTEPTPLDIDGDPRFVDDPAVADAGTGTPPIVDIGVDEFVDSDEDGLPDWWEMQYFGSTTSGIPGADTDTDGLSNLAEYEEFGSNPVAIPLRVPDEYLTIQAALDVAIDGDTILVAAGEYTGTGNIALDFNRKSVVVRAPGGPAATTINLVGTNGIVDVDSVMGTHAVLDGFTITGGQAEDGGGVRASSSRLILANCVVTGNDAAVSGGGLYALHSNPSFDELTLVGNTASSGTNGVVIESSVNLPGRLLLADGVLEAQSSFFYGAGGIDIALGALLKITGSPGDRPTVLQADLSGTGDVLIEAGQELVVEAGAVVDLSTNGDVSTNACEAGCPTSDPSSWGTIFVDGTLSVSDATIRNTNVEVSLAEVGSTDLINNDIRLKETSDGYGGEFFVEGASSIACNHIESEGDRYLDLDPDPAAVDRPTICRNTISVAVTQGAGGERGELLELRAEDFDCNSSGFNPDCRSGHFAAGGSPGFTEDPSENWVLEELRILPGAKIGLTNRPGFQYAPSNGIPETVYVRNVVLYPDAVLNTGLQAMYYENIEYVDTNGNPVGTNGARILDQPLLGFSLVNIAFDDDAAPPHNEFDVRIRERLRDAGDTQPCTCDGICGGGGSPIPSTCLEGLIERVPNAITGTGGMMSMRTHDPDKHSASSVAAKGAFARAGYEEIIVTFEYAFVDAPIGSNGTKLNVYLSDDPDVGERLIKVAEIYPPPAGVPGGDSSRFATFVGEFPWDALLAQQSDLSFVRGTYVELELVAAKSGGVPSDAEVWIDNFDPQVWCDYECGDFNGETGVDDGDFLVLLSEAGQSLPEGKECLDVDRDGYVDLNDALSWDVRALGGLSPCAPPEGKSAQSLPPPNAKSSGLRGDSPRLRMTGKPTGHDLRDMTFVVEVVGTDGLCIEQEALACPTGINCAHGGLRYVTDPINRIYVVHGMDGVLPQSGDSEAPLFARGHYPPEGVPNVHIGMLEAIDAPLADAGFAAEDMGPDGPRAVYLAPVLVATSDHTFLAAARLDLSTGDAAVLGIDPAADPDACVNATVALPGGAVKPACDLTGARALEVDSAGNVFVASAQGYNDNDWVLIYNYDSTAPGHETARVRLSGLFGAGEFEPPRGPNALRVSRFDPTKLYLASSVAEQDSLITRLYRFDIVSTSGIADGLAFSGAIEIEHAFPRPCNQIQDCVDETAVITAIEEDPRTGMLYVVGYSAPRFPADLDLLDFTTENFTTPTLAVIDPESAPWQFSPPVAGEDVIAAHEITGCDLALPYSAVLEIGLPGDFDGDGDVDLDDYAIFGECLAGPGTTPPFVGGSVTTEQCLGTFDLDTDGDVDLDDFALFSRLMAL